MKNFNLTIECSGMGAEVAVCDGPSVLAVRTLPPNQGTVRSLSPAIRDLVGPNRRPTWISVTTGPGSFTGLRVGLATAKLLGYAWRCPLVGVDTLAAIARRHGEVCSNPQPAIVVPVLDAFRRQVFAAAWHFDGEKWLALTPSQVVDAASWQAEPLESLEAEPLSVEAAALWSRRDELPVWITGPGLEKYPPADALGPRVQLAERKLWTPTARAVAEIGWELYRRGKTASATELLPNYVRDSAAQERLREKQSSSQ